MVTDPILCAIDALQDAIEDEARYLPPDRGRIQSMTDMVKQLLEFKRAVYMSKDAVSQE